MGKTYERANAKVIQKAVKRLVASKELSLKMGMYSLLEDAVKVALNLHDETHQSHITLGDTYGWMLVIDGRIDRIQVESRGDKVGQASKMLRSYVGKVPGVGIWGIVMAGMEPANYFSINYEKIILESTIQFTRYNFYQYFKKI